jgi:hypothetical protein
MLVEHLYYLLFIYLFKKKLYLILDELTVDFKEDFMHKNITFK